MSGILVLSNNYTYDGEIYYNKPHGYGTYQYENGDRYIGQNQFGKKDGFGKYYFNNGASYEGYFSYDDFHGIGTYENATYITKGSWRRDLKHGTFITTNKLTETTMLQLWLKNQLKKEEPHQYVQPSALKTIKDNPHKLPKKTQKGYHGSTAYYCIGCTSKPVAAANASCGHVCMCYECLAKCEKCPICRCTIDKVVRLIISVNAETPYT